LDAAGHRDADIEADRGLTALHSGHERLVTSGPDYDAIQSKVRAKYRAMVPISRLFNTLGHLGKGTFPYGDVGVVVTLEP
jgi:hypothetical protein